MMGRISSFKVLRALCTVLIEFSRGVPTLLFILFLSACRTTVRHPASGSLEGRSPCCDFRLRCCGEVLRSGVNAVPKGQTEAALSLGMRCSSVFFKIIFPQALRFVVPALISELVIVLKDTTFAYIVSYSDLMQNARVLISNYDALLSVYLVTAIIYILINYILNKISVAVARRTR